MPGSKSRAAVPDLNSLPDHATLTRKQVAALTGFADITLRVWAGKGRGPKVTRLEGVPRYLVRDLRAWLEGDAQAGQVTA